MKKTITIREYGAFCVGKENDGENNGYVTLESTTFQLLERFILENNREGKDDALEIMGISARRGIGKIITAKNFVGIIALNDGTTIEILPKIYAQSDNTEEARSLLVRMLNTLFNTPNKNLQTANLDVSKMNVLEVFIRMFTNEVIRLTKQGLKSNYETLEENLHCFKGKILFSQHIRRNFAHKERFYAAYDAFTLNRPENKLLKSTLLYLFAHTRSSKNKTDIKNLLNVFSEVDASTNYDADFARIVPDRNTKTYTTALNWARVFLKKKSFTSFSGSTVSMALLFPMEKLFESYVAALMRKCLTGADASLSTQDTKHHLFDHPTKHFLLKPDLVLTANGKTYVMDTKWKRLNSDPGIHYGISQGDMYQMYAYYHKYKPENVTLLYPSMVGMPDFLEFTDQTNNAHFFVKFIDMQKEEESIRAILENLGVLP